MRIAMVSKKGGVGKTTTAVNLAAGLARLGKRVLLVDLDSQASTSLSLGIPRGQLAPSIADVLSRRVAIEEAVRYDVSPRLDLITASTDLAAAERDLAALHRPEEQLKGHFDKLERDYDVVMLDCQASLSVLPTAALFASDAFITPMTPHFLALEGLENLLQAVDRLSFRRGAHIHCLGILLTQVDYRTRIARANTMAIREQHGARVFAIEMRINVRLTEAPAYGKTIFDYAPESPAAQSFELLAEEVSMRLRKLPRQRSRSIQGLGQLRSVGPR